MSLRSLTASSQVTCPVPLPPSSVACLESLLLRELRGVEASAQRLGVSVGTSRGCTDAESLRLASSFQQLLQPPLRHHCEYHASAVNARPSPCWPVSGEVCVPLGALQSVGSGGGLALPGLLRQRTGAEGGSSRAGAARGSAARAAAGDEDMGASAQAGGGGSGGAGSAGSAAIVLPPAKRSRARQGGPAAGFDQEE